MKTALMVCLIVAFAMVHSKGSGKCGSETCSPAQVCLRGKCVCFKHQCPMFCPYGFKKDEHGCQYPCTCAEGPTKKKN